MERKAVRPDKIVRRRVGEPAIGVQIQRAVGRPGEQCRRQVGSINIQGIGQYAGLGQRQRRVFRCAVILIGHERSHNDIADRHGVGWRRGIQADGNPAARKGGIAVKSSVVRQIRNLAAVEIREDVAALKSKLDGVPVGAHCGHLRQILRGITRPRFILDDL